MYYISYASSIGGSNTKIIRLYDIQHLKIQYDIAILDYVLVLVDISNLGE